MMLEKKVRVFATDPIGVFSNPTIATPNGIDLVYFGFDKIVESQRREITSVIDNLPLEVSGTAERLIVVPKQRRLIVSPEQGRVWYSGFERVLRKFCLNQFGARDSLSFNPAHTPEDLPNIHIEDGKLGWGVTLYTNPRINT